MVDSLAEIPLKLRNSVSGGAMKFFRLAVLLVLPALFMAGCKDKAEEQAVVPPPTDSMAQADSPAIQAVDTMPAVTEAPGMPPAPKGDGYAVQVASCSDEAYARYLLELWKGRGYEPFVSTITHESETHYRVRLGLFQTQAEAKELVAELEDKYTLKTWVDQVSN